MFTGIIKDIGTVMTVTKSGDTRFNIHTSFDMTRIEYGASIACSGVCLTVVDKGPGWFAVDASEETLSRTSLGRWQEGTKINLERSLKVGDEIGGHYVMGHVDGVGTVDTIKPIGGSRELVITVPENLVRFIAEKGSIAVDGISLTVNGVEGSYFWVNIIPYTWQHTTLGNAKEGSQVNVEVDVWARYMARQYDSVKNLS